MRLGRLNRRITILRASTATRDSLNTPVKVWSEFATFWAEQQSQRPVESWKAGQSAAQNETQFRLRWSARAATITAQDRLTCEGRTFEVIGVTEPVARAVLELIAIAATD